MIIGGAYQAVVNPVYGVISFIILVMIISIFFCWSRSVTGSVIPAIILHTAHNEIDQVYLKSMSHQESIPYFAGEQGFVTIICAALIAAIVIWSWKKHKKSGALSSTFYAFLSIFEKGSIILDALYMANCLE